MLNYSVAELRLKIKCSIRDKQITMFRMYKALCGGW